MEINAVFEGGGVKGIALAGAVEATERAGRTFGRVAGTSSGSIIASLLAAGYDGEAMSRIIRETPFTSFLKRGALYNTAVIGPAIRVLIKKAFTRARLWNPGSAAFCWRRVWLHSAICRAAG